MSDLPVLLYDDVEQELRATLRALLDERSPWTAVLARVGKDHPEGGPVAGAGDAPVDESLWTALGAELGVTGLLVPEELGGAGATAREAAVVLEELGRSVAAVPFLESSVLATTLLVRCGHLAAPALRRLAVGGEVAAVAVDAATWPQAPFPSTVTAEEEGATGWLTGGVRAVLAGARADLLVVPVLIGRQPKLAVVDVAGVPDGCLTRAAVVTLDPTRPMADLTFRRCPATILAGADTAEATLQHGLGVAAALLASEQLGVAERSLQLAVEYLGVRRQFGRVIGSFQALKHRAADLWADVNASRAAARYAAACVAEEREDLPVAAALAQAQCSAVAVRAAEECVQLHGGIGFTWEHPAHLYLKRAASQAVILGGVERHRTALADLLDLPSA